jgi:uncharacterized DUF497 family protein
VALLPGFEWDDAKAAATLRKHGVAFDDATLVWDDPHHLLRFDRIEAGEERWHVLGIAAGIVLLLVVHTYPGGDDDRVRIVSARRATKSERRAYEDGDP